MISAEAVREMRRAARMTQEQAASVLSITRVSWARYESGARRMSPQLARLFKMLTNKQRKG